MHNAADHDTEKSVKEGYEVTDMNARLIAYFIVALFAMLFGAVMTIIIVIRGFDRSRPALNDTPASALATPDVQVPPAPHLQGDPVSDLHKVLAENTARLNAYGVLSEEPGMERVHIPVERAMALVASGAAPYRQEPTIATTELVDPFGEDAL